MKAYAWHVTVGVLVVLAGACRGADSTTATGTLELVETDVAPIVPARVLRVFVDEGMTVRTGDTLATLTQVTTRTDIDGARARLRAAEATLADLEAGARPAEIDRAQAELRATEAEAVRTASDLQRSQQLIQSRVISQQQLDNARAAAAAAASRRAAAAEALRLLQEGARPEQVRAARAEVAAARSALAAAEAMAGDLVLRAPVDGRVMGRHVEPGEVIGAGTPAVTIGDVMRPWVRVYVSEFVLPRVHVGDPVTARLDALPDRPFFGRVVAIRDQAEYTPRVALTEDERHDLLFGVKVQFDDTTTTLKAGLPVTVSFRMSAP